MGRAINIIVLVAMIVAAIVTYDMKHDAEVAADEVARLQTAIGEERDRIAFLKAELSALTQPGRLQSVVDAHADYFQLRPFSPDQVGAVDEIPLRPVVATAPSDPRSATAGDAIRRAPQ